MATSKAEFLLGQAINKEEAKQMVYEIFPARVACEAILRDSGWAQRNWPSPTAGTAQREGW